MDADDFVTLSARREFIPSGKAALEGELPEFLSTLAAALRKGGCSMVGHIKGMVEDGGPSPLFFSLTSLDSDPQYKGGPLRPGSASTLSMNIIIAGIGSDDAARILEDAMARCFRI